MATNERSVVALLVEENVGLIEQAVELIASIDLDRYTNNEHAHFSSGMGKHVRHILDFYDRFVQGRGSFVDYNARRRDERIESDPDYAITVARATIESLRDIVAETDGSGLQELEVSSEVQDEAGDSLRVASSLGRELSTLASHTVHHYAIIALLLRMQGQPVSAEFGVAPSTLRYLASQES
jgi:hypothetical protein